MHHHHTLVHLAVIFLPMKANSEKSPHILAMIKPVTDFPGQCMTQVNARRFTPKSQLFKKA
jgi:hypothetical protein